ncbi:hypothetical protein ACFWP4_22655, partial [Streptomyces sp. NPDC058486]
VLEQELGLYPGAPGASSVHDLYTEDPNFTGDVFLGPGTGQGGAVLGNVASVLNQDTVAWSVYTQPYGGGSDGYVPPGYRGYFSPTLGPLISSAYRY